MNQSNPQVKPMTANYVSVHVYYAINVICWNDSLLYQNKVTQENTYSVQQNQSGFTFFCFANMVLHAGNMFHLGLSYQCYLMMFVHSWVHSWRHLREKSLVNWWAQRNLSRIILRPKAIGRVSQHSGKGKFGCILCFKIHLEFQSSHFREWNAAIGILQRELSQSESNRTESLFFSYRT